MLSQTLWFLTALATVSTAGVLPFKQKLLDDPEKGSHEHNVKGLMTQLYSELLQTHDGSISTKESLGYQLEHDEDPAFKAMCGFYQRNQLQYPDDDYFDDLNAFSGIVTFAHLPQANCFVDPNSKHAPSYDIAIVGAPFDTAVSYRPGARFGPNGIRQGSRRLGAGLSPVRGFPGSKLRKLNPYDSNYKIVDCGDVPMTPYDNRIALNQLYRGQRRIHNQTTVKETEQVPRIITLGGDHTITLMALKSAYEHHGPMAVIHFDSHIDTWDPKILGGGITKRQSINHGTFLHFAHENGYIADGKSLHVGIRAPFIDPSDEQHDYDCGFEKIVARDLDIIGIKGITRQIKDKVGDLPVYLTIDIDVLDLSVAPGTGTPEPGGLTSRELLTILDGLEGLNIIGADVVEVLPAFDTNGDITTIVAAQVIDSILGLMTVE